MPLQLLLADGELPKPESVTGGPWLGVFFTVMVLASLLLWRSLNKRLQRMDQRERELTERDSSE